MLYINSLFNGLYLSIISCILALFSSLSCDNEIWYISRQLHISSRLSLLLYSAYTAINEASTFFRKIFSLFTASANLPESLSSTSLKSYRHCLRTRKLLYPVQLKQSIIKSRSSFKYSDVGTSFRKQSIAYSILGCISNSLPIIFSLNSSNTFLGDASR